MPVACILPRFTEKPGGGAENLPGRRRLLLRQIESLVRTLNEVKDQLVPKDSKKLKGLRQLAKDCWKRSRSAPLEAGATSDREMGDP